MLTWDMTSLVIVIFNYLFLLRVCEVPIHQ